MSKNCLITRDGMHALASRYDFTQVEKGVRESLNEFLVASARKLVLQSIINAEHNKHKGLKAEDAIMAIRITPEIPEGLYEVNTKKTKKPKEKKEKKEEQN